MLTEVGDGVWVRQSAWVWSNTTVVRGENGLVVVDPGIHRREFDELADDLERLGLPVVAGFSTHAHWDHLLWHPRLGAVPRYARVENVQLAAQARERGRQMALETAPDIPVELLGDLTPLPDGVNPIPGEIVAHEAHAAGHAALRLADRGVLLVGDMLSDELIPMLDPRRTGQLDAYDRALDRLTEAAAGIDAVVPGHGSVARGAEIAHRLRADRAYLDALRRGDEPDDPRLSRHDWLAGPHRGNQEQART